MNNESLQYELTHLVGLAAAPYREYWTAYVKAKAKGLAKHYPEEYSQLPQMLEKALSQSPCGKATPTTGEGFR